MARINHLQYLSLTAINDQSHSHLLEDVVRLLLGDADPFGLGYTETLGDQEVGDLAGPGRLKHLPLVKRIL